MGSSSLTTLLSKCLFIFYALFRSPALAFPVYESHILVNFTVSPHNLIDNAGTFLVSENRSFSARLTYSKLFSSQPETSSVYLLVVHVPSDTVVWSANRNHPLLWSSSLLQLTTEGLTLYNHTTQPIWSTPQNGSSVSSLHLLESGNLLLLDATSNIVWQSFDSPTDVLVAGQKLRLGRSLSEGSYRLVIGDDDATLQWNGMTYWKLSMGAQAFRETASRVEFLMVNATGVFLMGGNGEEVVIRGNLDGITGVNSSDFVFAKLDNRGLLNIITFKLVDSTSEEVFEGPDDKCQVPMVCRRLGVCSNGGSCSCLPGFYNHPEIDNGDCVPTDRSLLLQPYCNNVSLSEDDEDFKYLSLRDDLDYFSNDFSDPVIRNVNLSFCQNLCSKNCSCLGVFYTQSSGSCHMIRNYLGSMKSGSRNRAGYLKMTARTINVQKTKADAFPILAVVVAPSIAILVIAMVTVMCLARRRRRRRRRRFLENRASSKLGRSNSYQAMDLVSIPGLPVKLDYEEVAEATQDFSTEIGSGGFGTVYRGTLRDGSEVAVKKITCLGAEGKRQFLSEIVVIGKIQHVNLVKLKGFCVHNGQRLLIYEYMNRGSLDRTLFHGEAVLEWEDRCKIAVGAARGLEYLHSGCESKIIHLDVKPENILLNDKLQVKVADFGLSKLLSREQASFFTTMRGTRGYLAPEWLINAPISDKTDVYSYGMMLLEIVSGVHNFSVQRQFNIPQVHEQQCLVNFPLRAVEMHVGKRYMELVDPRLKGNAPSEEVEKLVRVALCCLHRDPKLRPSMSNVVWMLEGGMALCKPRLELLNFLRFYGCENNQQNELALDRQEMSFAATSGNSFSYICSHQVSGPR